MLETTFDHLVEKHRLETLNNLKIMDTLPEERFDDLVKLSSQIAHCPVALVSLIDANKQWFKAKVGIEVTETPRHIAFCNHIVKSGESMIVNDATLDERFCDNPLVTQNPHVRFYAGFPIISREGYILGTLCVIDFIPRVLVRQQIESLEALARQICHLLELRRKGEEVNAYEKVLHEQTEQVTQIGSHLKDVVWMRDAATGRMLYANTAYENLFERPLETAMDSQNLYDHAIHPKDQARVIETKLSQPKGWFEEIYRIITPSGQTKWVLDRSFPIKDQMGNIVRIAGVCADVTPKPES